MSVVSIGQLMLREETGGPRYYLYGEPVHAGTTLELLLPGSTWLAGRYEWDSQRDARPSFYFSIGGEWERNHDLEPVQVVIRIPEGATFRWPKSR